MKWFKRCWLSIVRRPGKSSMLFFISLGMMTLLAGSLAIISTSETIKKEIEIGLGSEATVTNELYVWNNYSKEEIYSTIDEYKLVMDKLIDDERVAFGEYHINTIGLYRDFFKELDFDLYSTNIVESKDFRDGVNKLVTTKGNRYFTKEEIENGEMVIMTSYSLHGEDTSGSFIKSGLCELNNEVTLTIPLKYEFISSENNENDFKVISYDFKVKVVGIFNSENNDNIIYMPQKAFEKVVADANDYAKEIGINDLVNLTIDYTGFKLKDGKSLDSFDRYAKDSITTIKNAKVFKYLSSNDSYERNAGPIENLEAIAKYIFIAAFACTVIVISLVGIFFISDRKTEIGIYASIGERKRNIMSQILCEMLLVTTLAISISSVTGLLLGNSLSDYMLEVQKYTERQQDLGIIADLPVIYKPVEDGLTVLTRDDIIDNYNIELSIEYFAVLFAVGEFSVLIASSISIIYLLKLKPKEIMM